MKRMVRYLCSGYCVNSIQSIDKQLFSDFPADPSYAVIDLRTRINDFRFESMI